MSHRYAFSTRGVLRHLHGGLFQEYCLSNGLLLEPDFVVQNDIDVDGAVEAIQSLPHERRTGVEQDLHDVYDLADDQGQHIIYEEAKSRGEDLTGILTELDGAYDVALWLLLNRSDLFNDLLHFHSADTLNRRYWRRRRVEQGHQADTSKATIDRLSRSLTDYLVMEEGRGLHCFVECLERASGVLFVAYPEDFGTTILEYEGDDLVKRKIRPATDLLFFFDSWMGTLDVFCHGPKRKVKDLQQLFGLVVLGVKLPDDDHSATIYDLNRLKDEAFEFPIDPMSRLEGIEVKWVQVRDRDGGRGVTVEVGGPPGRGLLYSAGRYWSVTPGEQTDKYPFHLMDIERAKLQAHFRPVGRRRRGRTKTFTIAGNGCLLDHEGADGIIRRALLGLEVEQRVGELAGV